jgi:hypothetical protein
MYPSPQSNRGRTPSWLYLLIALVAYGLLPRLWPPVVISWERAHEIVGLFQQYQQLLAQNEDLQALLEFVRTPEGKELLARQRYGLLRPGEWLVEIHEVPPPPPREAEGLRRFFDQLRKRIDEPLSLLRQLHQCLQIVRQPNFPSP